MRRAHANLVHPAVVADMAVAAAAEAMAAVVEAVAVVMAAADQDAIAKPFVNNLKRSARFWRALFFCTRVTAIGRLRRESVV